MNSDTLTSQVPSTLLTARADLESQLRGCAWLCMSLSLVCPETPPCLASLCSASVGQLLFSKAHSAPTLGLLSVQPSHRLLSPSPR